MNRTVIRDLLAARGTVFNGAYCQQAVCSPSRLSLMTGSVSLALATLGRSAEPNTRADVNTDGILFSESFEDTDLVGRNWYDGTKFRITGDAMAGKGCIEYEWPDPQSGVKGSSPVRRLFEPTDEVSIRFYLKLAKGWGWSGRNYHPHLTHFLTTENSKWHDGRVGLRRSEGRVCTP